VASLKDHLLGLGAATALGPLPKKLVGEAAAGGESASRFTTLFSKFGLHIKDWSVAAPALGPIRPNTVTHSDWLLRGVGRAIAPAALIINAGELLKAGQDAVDCYNISH